MDKSIKGTQTEKNLLKAFAGESQAKNRYTFFSKKAKEEGYEQIAELFMITAMQEETHAKQFFKFLEGGAVEITATYPAGSIGTTAENLKAAAMGEHEEWTDLYPHFAEVLMLFGVEAMSLENLGGVIERQAPGFVYDAPLDKSVAGDRNIGGGKGHSPDSEQYRAVGGTCGNGE